MLPVKTKEATHILQAPANFNDGDPDMACGALPVTKDGFQMASYWRPSDEERALLANGGDVELVVVGVNHPVVSLSVVDPLTGEVAA